MISSQNPIGRKAFVVVVIESVWPAPGGADSDGIASGYDGRMKQHVGLSNGTSDNHQDITTEQNEANKGRGYMRIIPLNYLNVTTTTNVAGGSQFSITFSFDDLLLINQSSNIAFNGSSGILGNTFDLAGGSEVASGYTLFQQIISSKGGNSAEKIPTFFSGDEDSAKLGYTAWKLDAARSMFSIDDVITPMDTVSVWLYNDPDSFMQYDNIVAGQNGLSSYRELSMIGGSLSRVSQYYTSDDELIASISEATGLSQLLNTRILDQLVAGGKASDISTNIKISDAMSKESAIAFALRAFSMSINGEPLDSLVVSNNNQITRNPLTPTLRAKIMSTAMIFSNFYFDENNDTPVYVKDAKEPPEAERDKIEFSPKYTNLDKAKPNAKHIYNYVVAVYQNKPHSEADKNMFNSFLKSVVAKTSGKLAIERTQASVGTPNMGSGSIGANGSARRIGRTSLRTIGHGETPYLIFRGHITAIQDSYSVKSQNTVRISGGGYDYPATKHITFFNDVMQYAAANQAFQQYLSTYAHTNPARAMAHLLVNWMPRRIVVGAKARNTAIFQLMSDTYYNYADGTVMQRGNVVFFPKKDRFRLPYDDRDVKDDVAGNSRIFTPLHYLNTSRMDEMERAMLKADPTGELNNAVNQFKIEGNQPIWKHMENIAGPKNLYELFVDEKGYIIYRMGAEAWERTPRPDYSPTVEDDDLIEFRSILDDSQVLNVVDVIPSALYSTNTPAAGSTLEYARSMPTAGYLPMNDSAAISFSKAYPGTASPSHWRFGLRHTQISDPYGIKLNYQKAATHIAFSKNPTKTGEAVVVGNPSYRAGETVLFNVRGIKKRSSFVFSTDQTATWLSGLAERQYVGVENRLLYNSYTNDEVLEGRTKEFQVGSYLRFPPGAGFEQFKVNPHGFVREKLVKTLDYLFSNGIEYITQEYFPKTLWYYLEGGPFIYFDNVTRKSVPGEVIAKLYILTIQTGLGGDKSKEIAALIKQYSPAIVEALQFQNHLSRSYYIESVTQSFDFGQHAQTTLRLNHGQDVLLIEEPNMLVALGFFSVERKVRIGDDFDPYTAKDENVWLKLYKTQFAEDNAFKESSFLFRASALRNSAIFKHSIAHKNGLT